jgi:protein SCO1/2
LLTGEKDSIYALAEAYSISVAEDEKAPGGFIHSGAFVLVDQQGHIRGFYDGTREADVDRLIADIRELLGKAQAP